MSQWLCWLRTSTIIYYYNLFLNNNLNNFFFFQNLLVSVFFFLNACMYLQILFFFVGKYFVVEKKYFQCVYKLIWILLLKIQLTRWMRRQYFEQIEWKELHVVHNKIALYSDVYPGGQVDHQARVTWFSNIIGRVRVKLIINLAWNSVQDLSSR